MYGLIICLCCLAVGTLAWINQFDQPFDFQCGANQFLSHINSVHDNHKEDRVWDFGCHPIPLEGAHTQNCAWTNYVNDFDKPESYQCPYENVMAGVSSVHDNHKEDRKFKFYCCDVKVGENSAPVKIHNCYYTAYVNDLDGILDYIVPAHKVLRGINSYHDNHHEDRRFKFEVCEIDA